MSDPSLYRTWDSDSQKQEAYAQTGDTIEAYEGVQRALGYGRRTSYIDIEPNRSVRTSFVREDYDRFRESEQLPHFQKRIIRLCMQAYDHTGIVKNVIDLMGDFASQGITLVHPNKNIEKFYRGWFEQINGIDRSERFLNYFYRCGNVIVRRRTAKINKKRERELRRSVGDEVKIEDIDFKRREIGWKYDFLNPLAVDVKNYGVSNFTGNPELVLNMSKYTQQSMLGGNGNNKLILKTLPDDLRRRLESGDRIIPLDRDKTSIYYYKKDDWLMWANPMIYAILEDIMMLEKMKLADLAALDGAISNVRLWTVGDLDHKIIPTKAAINKLRDILASNVGGGTMDLVWGPELKFTESQSQVYKFLGSEKYQPVLTSIYAGLGIPPTLTGAATGGGYSNNYVSLKTLVERLEYGREMLTEFWLKEIEIVQKAMGFRFPAQIHFDSIILSDEAASKQLLIQLADRDIISQETLLERFRELPNIERIRVRREERERINDPIIPDKASPYHNPQHKNDIAKIAITKDVINTDEYLDNLGLPTREETVLLEENIQKTEEPRETEEIERYVPMESPGRPKFSRDQQKRKQKRVLPRSKGSVASATMWGIKAQDQISEVVTPAVLNHFGKKNVRSLTKSEVDELEYLKLCIFTGMTPYVDITPDLVKNLIDNNTQPSESFAGLASEMADEFNARMDKKPTVADMKHIYASTFAELANF